MNFHCPPLLACALAAVPSLAWPQATVKPDGEFRYALGVGASYASGNTSAASVTIDGEGVRATADSKWRFGGRAVWTRNEGTTTAENATLGMQYDHDFTPRWFGFGSADYLRDEFANISSRYSGHAGLGRHVIKREELTWDVSAGLGYTQDRYVDAATVDSRLRTRFGRAELLLAEESQHRWTPTTSLRQKLSVFPALSAGGGVRGLFDAGLGVAMTPAFSLTVGLVYRYDSAPGAGLKHGDTLVTTGISLKLD